MTKKNRSKKNDDAMENCYKSINNVVSGKSMENVRNRNDVRLVSNEGDYLKWIPRLIYMSLKIFGNDLATIRKIKVTSTFYKLA